MAIGGGMGPVREVDGRGSTSEGIGGGAAAHLHLVEFERKFVKGVVSFRLKREHCDSRGCGTVV